MTESFIKAGVIVSVLGLLGACAHQVPAMPSASAIPMPAHKVPLNVGVYFSDSFANYQHSDSKWGDTWNFPHLGQASANQFRDALEKNFTRVTKLNGKPGKAELEAQALDLVIAPEITSYEFDIPLTKFQTYPARITYRIEIFDGETPGTSILVDGVGDTVGSPGFDFSANPARSASKAIEVGVNQAVTAILDTAPVRAMSQKKMD